MKKLVFLLPLLGIVLSSCGGENTSSSSASITSQSSSSTATSETSTTVGPIKRSGGFEGTIDGYTFSLPDLGEDVEIHTEKQKEYLTSKWYATVNKYADGLKEVSYQEKVKLSFSVKGENINSYKVRLSINEDMSESLLFETNTSEVEVDNLMIDTLYYWDVSVNLVTSGTAKFVTTSLAPRNLRVDGVKNVRDLGRTLQNGKKIKQNSIIRCGALTENYTGNALIKDTGITYFNEVLHMKTEIDLRGEPANESANLTQSILGKQVNYQLIGLIYTGGNLLLINKTKMNEIFSIFANENNYPICFHCSEGTDRAGMVAFILNALLGVSEEDCYRDYLFSAFRFCSGKIPELNNITKNNYVETIKSYPGKNLQEQTYNALIDLGVQSSYLDSFINLNVM